MQIGNPLTSNSLFEKSLYVPILSAPVAAIKILYNVCKVAISIIVALALELACSDNRYWHRQASYGAKNLVRGVIALIPCGGIYLYYLDKNFKKPSASGAIERPERIPYERPAIIDIKDQGKQLADSGNIDEALNIAQRLLENNNDNTLYEYIYKNIVETAKKLIPEKWSQENPLTTEKLQQALALRHKTASIPSSIRYRIYPEFKGKNLELEYVYYINKKCCNYINNFDENTLKNNHVKMLKIIKDVDEKIFDKWSCSYLKWYLLFNFYQKISEIEDVDWVIDYFADSENIKCPFTKANNLSIPKVSIMNWMIYDIVTKGNFSDEQLKKAWKIHHEIERINEENGMTDEDEKELFFKMLYKGYFKLKEFNAAESIARQFFKEERLNDALRKLKDAKSLATL